MATLPAVRARCLPRRARRKLVLPASRSGESLLEPVIGIRFAHYACSVTLRRVRTAHYTRMPLRYTHDWYRVYTSTTAKG
jgi:hypothetical protein